MSLFHETARLANNCIDFQTCSCPTANLLPHKASRRTEPIPLFKPGRTTNASSRWVVMWGKGTADKKQVTCMFTCVTMWNTAQKGGRGGNSKELAVFLWSLKNKQGGRKNELKYVNEFRSGFYLKKKKKVRMFESLWKQQWIGLQAFLNSVAAIFSLSSTLSTNFRFPASA